MAGCKLDVICKHFVLESFTECVRKGMCKFFTEGDKAIGGGKAAEEKRHYKKRAKTAPDDDNTDIGDCNITEKQFKKARKKISNAKQNKGIDENQEKALESLKGVKYKNATAAQKEQIIGIAKDL
jgi:hypothetical protein